MQFSMGDLERLGLEDVSHRVKVLIDGVQRNDCVECDEENGCAVVIKTGTDGKFLLENGEIAYKQVYGVVRLEKV